MTQTPGQKRKPTHVTLTGPVTIPTKKNPAAEAYRVAIFAERHKVGWTYTCRSLEKAIALAEAIAADRGIEIVNNITPR